MTALGGVRRDARAENWLVRGGEMGKLVRSMDWSKTPLGPIESWPQSLRTTVSLCLASNFPISLAWGPKHVQIYNDGYWPICGGKHPHSTGQDFTECWASAWPVIGEAFERALAGETSYLENQRMFLDRYGYLEETFFTFSFSPIRDETGGVGGLFHPVTETTAKMLGERRTRALRDLVARTGKAQTCEDALTLAAQALAEFALDVPFALFYLLDAADKEARLIAQTGSLPEAIATPALNPHAPLRSAWPLTQALYSNRAQQLDDIEEHYGTFSCGPYPETPKTALAMPITPPGCERPIAVLVMGVSSRLPLTDTYRAFYDLLAAAVTTAVANARAHEEECKRTEALAEIDRAKTAFFCNVSHEFRTPLTLMLGPLEDELAERSEPLSAPRRARLQTAHRNTLRLLKLVNTLLDFSSIEAGRIQASYEPINLTAYTTELASVFRSAIEKGGLTFIVDCLPLPEPIYVDKDMWEKVVLNLLSNAFKHTFDGSIRLTLKWCGDHVEFAVADSGVGIPETQLPHLFDRFHRVKGAQSRTHEGTGIGLALAQELVHAHGWTLGVESREGRGSTFTVVIKTGYAHLPFDRLGASRRQASTATRAAAYVQEALHWVSDVPTASALPASIIAAAELPIVREGPATTTGLRFRILWADDNADMRDYVSRLLAQDYEVTAVPDGTAALAAALATPPDLVLADIMMPRLDGLGLLRELRADERTRTIPVILLSARAGEESSIEGLQAGADDYLIKPFSARELLARVQTHLELAQLRREWANELELRVQERTTQLARTSQDLALEILERRQAAEKLQAQLERLHLLHEITRVSGEHRDLQGILQVVIRTLEDHLPVDFTCICLYDAAARVLTVSSVGVHGKALAMELAAAEQPRIDIDQNGLSDCACGQLMYEPDISQVEFPFSQRLARGGLRSLVAAPLLVERKVFGILLAARERAQSFSSGECEFLLQLSEHVALAAHHAQHHAVLQQAYDDLRRTQKAVMQQERLRALGEMASGLAHGINNAISPVALYTQSLLEQEPGLSPRTRAYLETIQCAVEDVAETLGRMREFYRKREPELALVPVQVNAVVQQAVDLTRARWSDLPQRENVVEMLTELTPEPPLIMAVASELREALTNLISNSIDAMPGGGTLTLRTRVVGVRSSSQLQQVDVEVSDTGAGMSEDTRRRCLEPFFTTKADSGAGLGLAMVYGMAQRHSAEMKIDSAVGNGTTVRLRFTAPLAASVVTHAHPSKAPAAPPCLRVLIIDDEPLLLAALCNILETDGHLVVAANGGQAGINAFQGAQRGREPFAVVITDLAMPHVDGRRVAGAVKAASPSTPVILLTGWGPRLPGEGDIPPHVDRVLGKPPKLAELREALAQCCLLAKP